MSERHDAGQELPDRSEMQEAAEEERWPVGFILTIVMVGLYLGYRLIQGVVLLFRWAF